MIRHSHIRILLAARAAAVANLEAIDAALESAREQAEHDPEATPIAGEGCQHPQGSRIDRSTFGRKAFLCNACNTDVVEGGDS